MTSVHKSVRKFIFTCHIGTTAVKEMKKFAIFYRFFISCISREITIGDAYKITQLKRTLMKWPSLYEEISQQ